MEWMFVVVLVLAVPICLTVWLIVRALRARDAIERLSRRLDQLELELNRRRSTSGSESPSPYAARAEQPIANVPPIMETPEPWAEFPQQTSSTVIPPSPIPPPIAASVPASESAGPAPAPQPARDFLAKIDWEQFMGVKLFAWIGGLALFLGIAFFVKYSFDNNLISPELRMAMGFLTALGLLVGGVVLSRKDYAVLAQTLCGTGVVALYAVTFACRSIYHFQFFGPLPTFLLMALITTAAFFLAVRLNALVVALLGILGGFLTPILLSTGQDNPVGLFGYIALLDAGLILLALNRRWDFLASLAAAGTAFMQLGWAHNFFTVGRYFEGSKILIPLSVLLGFNALFLAASGWAKVRAQTNRWLSGSAFALVGVAFAFTAWFLSFAPLAQRPWLIFGFVFLIDVALTALVFYENQTPSVHAFAGFAIFGLLAYWTADSLKSNLLNAALAFYFLFSIVHSVVPMILSRRRGVKASDWVSNVFPALAIALVLIPLFRLTEISLLIWPFILLVDVLALGLAVLTMSILPVLLVFVLTLGATGVFLYNIPQTLTGLPTSFFLIGAFSVFFVMTSLWLARRFRLLPAMGKPESENQTAITTDFTAELPSVATILPFLLLIMAALRLPLANPSPLFGLALLLVALLLGVAKLYSLDRLPAIGLACVAAVEYAWHTTRFEAGHASQTLPWYLLFLGVFAVYPFLFRNRFADRVVPWATAAIAGVPQFFLVYRLVTVSYPNHFMGLLPAAFALVPILGLIAISKRTTLGAARLSQLAWFGGVALFFITLIFPIQFERQWLTIAWALEGAALLWLFHRLPHPGLRLSGIGLLLTAFARLALNPVVFQYHARSATPILNWYLYAYGIVTVCLFVGSRLLAPPRHQVLGSNVPPLLSALGTVLTFLLLNIQIADYFSEPGSTLTFQFSGNFARDMTYSIVWALFALVLLVVGILWKKSFARYAALGLLSITLIKLFFHDLANLGQLYRIGAFIGVAIVAMLASFAYQRFFTSIANETRSSHEADSVPK